MPLKQHFADSLSYVASKLSPDTLHRMICDIESFADQNPDDAELQVPCKEICDHIQGELDYDGTPRAADT